MKVDGPHTVSALGRKFYLKDNSDTPDTLQITLEYPEFVATYENRLCNDATQGEHGYGIEFYGTDGTMFVDRDVFQVFPQRGIGEVPQRGSGAGRPVAKTAEMKMERADDGLANHVANMLECMRTRKMPQTDIEYGYHSTSACLLGNVALRSKERIEWDVASQRLTKGGPAAQKLIAREYRAPWKLDIS